MLSFFHRSTNPLNGQHLRIIWPLWEGNPKGLSGTHKGGSIIDYLSNRFNFTYEMVRVVENWNEPLPSGQRGLFNYLWDQQADLLVAGVNPSPERIRLVDISAIWYYGNLDFLIPVSDDTSNIYAIVKPFQWLVWLSLALSILLVVFVLHQIRKAEKRQYAKGEYRYRSIFRCFTSNKEFGDAPKAGRQYLYVFGTLLSQGGSGRSKRLPFRLVAGAWVLAAFVFVQAYNSTLITYVITPIQYPLINSAYDIADNADITLVVRKGGTPDRIISDGNGTGIYKKLRERLNSISHSRCVLASECINLIHPGSKTVFLETYLYLVDAITNQCKKNGKSGMQLAKHHFLSVNAGLGLQKNSPYTKTISQGMIELLEYGFIDHWDTWFYKPPRQCMNNIKMGYVDSNVKSKHTPLSLKSLTGVFVVLLCGLTVSTLAFVYEVALFFYKKHFSLSK